MSAVAIPAVNRTIATGLKGYLSFGTTLSTYSSISLALLAIATSATGSFGFSGSSALRTTSRLIGKALFSVEFLLASGENEVFATVFAGQSLVVKHLLTSFRSSWLMLEIGFTINLAKKTKEK